MISVDPFTRRFNSKVGQTTQQSAPPNTTGGQTQSLEQRPSESQLISRVTSLESTLSITLADMAYLKNQIDTIKDSMAHFNGVPNQTVNTPQQNAFDQLSSIHSRISELETMVHGLINTPSTHPHDDIVSRVTDLEKRLTENLDIINKPIEAAPKKTVRRGIKLKSPESGVEEKIV